MKRKRKLKPLEIVIIVAPLLMLGVALLPDATLPRWSRIMEGLPFVGRNFVNRSRATCMSNLKQISIAVMQYTQVYGDRYPLTQFNGSRSVGWAEVLRPYYRNTLIFQCPTEGSVSSGDPALTDYTDYWFNANMAGRSLGSMAQPVSTVAFGDGNDGVDVADARYSKASLPANWLSDSNSPAYRHFVGANYAYADGHVKWTRPHTINSNSLPLTGWAPTFAIK